MYGILISLGILAGALIAEKEVKKRNLPTDILWDGLLILIVSGVIGARIYHVLDYWNYYKLHLLHIFEIWNGGLGILGGIFLAICFVSIYLKSKNQEILVWLDIAALGMPLGQAIGRWGNYFNKELLPYALYESLLDFILFLGLLWVNRKSEEKGVIFSLYLLGHALIRLTLEDLREQHWTIQGINVAKAFSLTTIIVILIIYAIHCLRSRWIQTKRRSNNLS